MSIEEAVKAAVKAKPRIGRFAEQLEFNRKFHIRMERAGVKTRKQEFSIPLMERIAHCHEGEASSAASNLPINLDAVAKSGS